MKFLDKIKNALFEEEYVEVEEKPKKKIPKEVKKVKKEVNHENTEEKPIAKKIVLPERKEVKITTHDDIDEKDEDIYEVPVEEEKEYKFPMISDSEFETKPTTDERFEKLHFDHVGETVERNEYRDYHHEKTQPKLYGMDDMPIPEPEYGTYEKKEDRTYFKPSPIISPIYGILDKNYKKEDVVPKREVRLTSSYSRENLDLDAVRNKAYGSLSGDVENSINEVEDRNIEEQSNFMDQDLLDLSNDSDTPEIKKVTVGDAEEYFNDLGLEYNVDYKDKATTKATGRRTDKQEDKSKITDEYTNQEPVIDEEEKFTPVVDKEEYEEQNRLNQQENSDINNDIDDDNLFDLIDSMYDKE